LPKQQQRRLWCRPNTNDQIIIDGPTIPELDNVMAEDPDSETNRLMSRIDLLAEKFNDFGTTVHRLESKVDGLAVDGLATTVAVAGLAKAMAGLESKVDGLVSKVDGLESKVDGLESKVDGLESKVDGLESKVDGLAGLESKVDGLVEQGKRLIAATPAAAEIPRVYVAGNKARAEKVGSMSTWTLVTAPRHSVKMHNTLRQNTNDNGAFHFFLVSCAHCVHSAITGQKKTSILPICANVKSEISKTIVIRVGFHKSSTERGYNFGTSPHTDIVFLELAANQMKNEGEDRPVIPTIVPHDEPVVADNVSGTSLSGRVNGSRLQWMDKNKIYSFIPTFAEPGCSGTLMFTTGDIIVGCFKGTQTMNPNITRGVIVPFPKWDQVQWLDCTMGLRRKINPF
jgi:outer membrane murein-binding lipoprotein Lpp